MKIRIEPYKMWSGGAKALGDRCGILRATRQQVERHGDFDVIINWGRSERRFNGEYINKPENAGLASDKRRCVEIFDNAGVPQPPWTVSHATACEWARDGRTIVARTLARASGGRGIVLCGEGFAVDIPRAPLYTQYIPKTDEYRVHVFRRKVIDVQVKKRRLDIPDDQVCWQIRNHSNGFIFARSEIAIPLCVADASIRAVEALGLDFGGVDVGYNAKRDKCRVYEVNTAPGIEGTTLDNYYAAFCELLPALKGGAYARRRA